MGRSRVITSEHVAGTQAEIARRAGVSEAAVSQNPRIVANPDGSVNVEATRANFTAVEDAQMRKETALAELRELELAEKRGLLLVRADVIRTWDEHITQAKNKLLAIGDEISDKLAAESNPLKCRELVNGRIREALAELATG